MRVICRLGLVVLWSVNVVAHPFTLQQPPETTVSVELGVEIAARGEQARLPVILSTHDKEVRSATVRVSFPAKKLIFQTAEAPSAGTKDRADLAAEVSSGGGEEKKTVELRVKSKPGSSLPDGIVALLVFKVAEDADPGDVVVANSPRVGLDNSTEQIAAQAKDGLVTILETPPVVIACMFYMH